MIAATLSHPRFEAETSTSVGSKTVGPTYVGLSARPTSSPRLEVAPEFEPAVFAVVINGGPINGDPVNGDPVNGGPARSGAPVDGPRNPQAVLDELVAVLERHFGNQVRVADLALSPATASRAVSARSPEEPSPLRFGRLTIDAARHEVFVDEQPTTLTKSEFDLLSVLTRRPGVVHTRREIVVASKGPNYPVDDRSIDVQMFNLRRKLGPIGRRLQTVRSVGYRFVPNAT
jgi:hypothetical protein